MTRLRNSSSHALRKGLEDWGTGSLLEMGYALSTKLEVLPLVVCRIDRRLKSLGDELNNKKIIDMNIEKNAAFMFSDKSLPYEILVDIDSFIYESRSAYEIVGQFLREFFKHILGEEIKEERLKDLLSVSIPDVRWIEKLKEYRKLFFHQTAPWIAVKIISGHPLRFELVVLKKNVKEIKEPDDYISFNELRSIYHGFVSSMKALRFWIQGKIEEFEAKA